MADRPPAPDRPRVTVDRKDLQSENAVLRELVTIYRHLSGLALQDADLASVTRLLADRTSATVAVVNQAMEVLAAAGPGATDAASAGAATEAVRRHVVHPRLGQVLRASRLSQRTLRLPGVGDTPPAIVAPVLVGDEVPAHLITLAPADKGLEEDVSLLVTEHAATICGVILGREHVVAGAARRVRDDLVEGLLLGRAREDGEAERWAAHLGYDAGRAHHVLIVAFEIGGTTTPEAAELTRQRLHDGIEHFFLTRATDAIISAREAEVVVIAPGPDGTAEPRRLGTACLARMTELFPDAKMITGIGGACRAPREIARSYAEAHRTIETLRRLGRDGTVTAFEDLGVHRLLLQVPDLAELRSFARDVLGGLSGDSSGHLTTLACYLRENSSPQRASRILHVHPNTVTYRIKQIEKITGLRLDDYRDRLMTQVALEILDALGEEQ